MLKCGFWLRSWSRENLCNEAFLPRTCTEWSPRAAPQEVLVADYAQRCGVDEELFSGPRIGTAASVLGVRRPGNQQAPNSTTASLLLKRRTKNEPRQPGCHGRR